MPDTRWLATSLAQMLGALLLSGAAFGALGALAARRGGRHSVFGVWLLISTLLGALGALRATRVQAALGFPPERNDPLGLFILFACFLAVVLLVPALALWRRPTDGGELRLARVTTASMGWTLLGLLTALVVMLALDLAGVPFVPGMP